MIFKKINEKLCLQIMEEKISSDWKDKIEYD